MITIAGGKLVILRTLGRCRSDLGQKTTDDESVRLGKHYCHIFGQLEIFERGTTFNLSIHNAITITPVQYQANANVKVYARRSALTHAPALAMLYNYFTNVTRARALGANGESNTIILIALTKFGYL